MTHPLLLREWQGMDWRGERLTDER
jgi:hypothetical protein